MSCGIGHRLSLDPALMWLWHRMAVSATIQSLAWEFPYATGVALKGQKRKKLNLTLSMYSHMKLGGARLDGRTIDRKKRSPSTSNS